MSTKYRLVYMTAGSRDEAVRVGRALVQARLAACANILDGMTSVFWWDGAVQEDDEVVLIAKTQAELIPALIDKVRETHSYDCPCVVTLPIQEGYPGFLDWIGQESRSPKA